MAEEKPDTDWLDDIFPLAKKQRETLEEKGLVFAQKYLVFVGPTSDPRARELLEHWTSAVRRARVPKAATAQEYAAYNAQREFVESIHAQVEFAQKGQNVPKPRT